MKQRLRAEHVKIRTVPCLECRALVGDPCLSVNGLVYPAGHISRRRMATLKAKGAQ